MSRLDPVAAGLAAGVAGAVWLHQSLSVTRPSLGVFVDRAIFLATLGFAAAQVAGAVLVRRRRSRRAPHRALETRVPLVPPLSPVRGAASRTAPRAAGVLGCVVLAGLVVAQTLAHLDERAAYLYMTYPGFPTGVGTAADGYVSWIDGHPTYAEAWQFGKLANVFSGASVDVSTGDHDARGLYAYLAALLARPLGFFPAFVALNVAFWLSASAAVWYVARALLGSPLLGYVAALLTAAGQGFVFMSSTPMSYAAGYAWAALLLALAVRWQLFGWRSDWRRWLLWGWLCGVGGLLYFTHVVVLGAAWLFGLRRAPLRGLVLASLPALALPAAWFWVGTELVGLGFRETTANDLFGQVRALGQLALRAPLLVPGAAGENSFRALMGGFNLPLLGLAALGVTVAAPRRREWYAAVAACGLVPVLVLHMIPVTQRYGYLAYPAIYVAAAEAIGWLGRGLGRALARSRARDARLERLARLAPGAVAAGVVFVQVVQANVDLAGVYRYTLAFGGP